MYAESKPQALYYAGYDCQRCGKAYTVNDPASWRQCTPEFCHDCLEHLNSLYYVEPENGFQQQ